MCGKEAVISDGYEDDKDQQELAGSNMITEQIDGTYYNFDTKTVRWCSKDLVLCMEAILQMNDHLYVKGITAWAFTHFADITYELQVEK